MHGTPNVSDEYKLIAELRADLDVLAGSALSARNDTNDYAAHWRARSGLLTPIPETEHAIAVAALERVTQQIGRLKDRVQAS